MTTGKFIPTPGKELILPEGSVHCDVKNYTYKYFSTVLHFCWWSFFQFNFFFPQVGLFRSVKWLKIQTQPEFQTLTMNMLSTALTKYVINMFLCPYILTSSSNLIINKKLLASYEIFCVNFVFFVNWGLNLSGMSSLCGSLWLGWRCFGQRRFSHQDDEVNLRQTASNPSSFHYSFTHSYAHCHSVSICETARWTFTLYSSSASTDAINTYFSCVFCNQCNCEKLELRKFSIRQLFVVIVSQEKKWIFQEVLKIL